MKSLKNYLHVIFVCLLIVIALGLLISMLFVLKNDDLPFSDLNVLFAGTSVGSVMFALYTLLLTRTNPKEYVYLTYSREDADLAHKIATSLEENFPTLSKYRFEILTVDSIPFGDNMRERMQENISRANTVIVIVSPAYCRSQWSAEEFRNISNQNKLIIPIVTESFGDLHNLPRDMSEIKAVSLIGSTEEDFSNKMKELAKDLIRRRKD